jgi:hypothetical protein
MRVNHIIIGGRRGSIITVIAGRKPPFDNLLSEGGFQFWTTLAASHTPRLDWRPIRISALVYGGLAAAYHRHRRRPESRTDKKHRTEFAPLLVQEFGRVSATPRIRQPDPAHRLTRMELLSFL